MKDNPYCHDLSGIGCNKKMGNKIKSTKNIKQFLKSREKTVDKTKLKTLKFNYVDKNNPSFICRFLRTIENRVVTLKKWLKKTCLGKA